MLNLATCYPQLQHEVIDKWKADVIRAWHDNNQIEDFGFSYKYF